MNTSGFPHKYCIKSGTYHVNGAELSMKLNEYGEYIPHIQGNAADATLLDAMSNQDINEDVIADELFARIPQIKKNPLIGYYKSLYAGYVSEGNYRRNASSGGMGTWIFKELFERGLIDGVIHVKPANDGDGILFKYAISRSIEEIQAGAKTKYYPAELSQVLKIVLEVPGKYAVIGIPSFIMEVRLLAKYNPIIKERIAFTIGLICGHQKTTKYAEALAWEFGIAPGNITSIDFRKKIDGLPATDYLMEISGMVDGKVTTFSRRHDLFFASNWGHGFFKPQFSDYTDDALNETADVALGDAWLPGYVEDSKGNNIVIARNEIIDQIISEGIASGKLHFDALSEQQILRSQSGLIHHIKDELPYRLYKKDQKQEWRPKKRVAASNNIPMLKKWVQDVRELIVEKSAANYQIALKKNDWAYFQKSMQPYVFVYKVIYKLIRMQQSLLRLAKK